MSRVLGSPSRNAQWHSTKFNTEYHQRLEQEEEEEGEAPGSGRDGQTK